MANNRDRAQWAETALRAFAGETGQLDCGDWDVDRENVIADFLCDLMHYCEAEKIPFAKMHARGQHHFHCEGGDGHAKDGLAAMED